MSVLACERVGCGNIMCDYLLLERYICLDCLTELNEVRKDWPHTMPKCDLEAKVRIFYPANWAKYSGY